MKWLRNRVARKQAPLKKSAWAQSFESGLVTMREALEVISGVECVSGEDGLRVDASRVPELLTSLNEIKLAAEVCKRNLNDLSTEALVAVATDITASPEARKMVVTEVYRKLKEKSKSPGRMIDMDEPVAAALLVADLAPWFVRDFALEGKVMTLFGQKIVYSGLLRMTQQTRESVFRGIAYRFKHAIRWYLRHREYREGLDIYMDDGNDREILDQCKNYICGLGSSVKHTELKTFLKMIDIVEKDPYGDVCVENYLKPVSKAVGSAAKSFFSRFLEYGVWDELLESVFRHGDAETVESCLKRHGSTFEGSLKALVALQNRRLLDPEIVEKEIFRLLKSYGSREVVEILGICAHLSSASAKFILELVDLAFSADVHVSSLIQAFVVVAALCRRNPNAQISVQEKIESISKNSSWNEKLVFMLSFLAGQVTISSKLQKLVEAQLQDTKSHFSLLIAAVNVSHHLGIDIPEATLAQIRNYEDVVVVLDVRHLAGKPEDDKWPGIFEHLSAAAKTQYLWLMKPSVESVCRTFFGRSEFLAERIFLVQTLSEFEDVSLLSQQLFITVAQTKA